MANMIIHDLWGWHDYWLTEEAVMKLRVTPWTLYLLVWLAIAMALLLTTGFGGVLGGTVSFAVTYPPTRWLASRRRRVMARWSNADVISHGKLELCLPYSSIVSGEVKGPTIRLKWSNKKLEFNARKSEVTQVKRFLESRLANRFKSL